MKLPTITQATLDRQSPNKHHLPAAKSDLVVNLSNGWSHYPATRIWPTSTLLGSPTLLPDQPGLLRILLKKVGPCSNWRTLVANAKQCHILSTAAGECCSNCTQLMTLIPNGWRHAAHKCTWQHISIILLYRNGRCFYLFRCRCISCHVFSTTITRISMITLRWMRLLPHCMLHRGFLPSLRHSFRSASLLECSVYHTHYCLCRFSILYDLSLVGQKEGFPSCESM